MASNMNLTKYSSDKISIASKGDDRSTPYSSKNVLAKVNASQRRAPQYMPEKIIKK